MTGPGAEHAITPVLGAPRPTWCPVCKAYAAVTCDLYALLPAGLTRLGAVAACEICDDPTDALPRARTSGGRP